MTCRIGVIGGTGLYRFDGLQDLHEVDISETPYGRTSCKPMVGRLHGKEVAFIARHGLAHDLTPSEVNYCANIWALKKLGVRYIFAVSAVGSLREEHRPMDIVIPLQFIDKTYRRRNTLFGEGIVAHVSFAHPVALELTSLIADVAKTLSLSVKCSLGGTYVCIEGPTFSTKAESELHRTWKADVVGMTNATEARVAREAEIAYATIALVTDYDCWRDAHEADEVSTETVLKYLAANGENAKKLVSACIAKLDTNTDMKAHHALENSIMNPKTIPQATREKLAIVIDRHLS